MSIQTKNLGQMSAEDIQKQWHESYRMGLEKMIEPKIEYSAFEQNLIEEKAQMRDQIEMLEREVDRQSTIIDALIKAIKVIERG